MNCDECGQLITGNSVRVKEPAIEKDFCCELCYLGFLRKRELEDEANSVPGKPTLTLYSDDEDDEVDSDVYIDDNDDDVDSAVYMDDEDDDEEDEDDDWDDEDDDEEDEDDDWEDEDDEDDWEDDDYDDDSDVIDDNILAGTIFA